MPWTIEGVIRETLRAFRRDWVALVFGNLFAILIAMSPLLVCLAINLLPMAVWPSYKDHPSVLVIVTTTIPSVIGTIWLAILFGPAPACLALASLTDERPRIKDIFDFRRGGTFWATEILGGLVVGGACLLLIVPGIIAMVGLVLAPFFVVDGPRELTAGEALRASWNATRGHKLQLFGLALLATVAHWVVESIFGLSNWLFPLQIALALVWTPLATVGLAAVYMRLRPPREPETVAAEPLLVDVDVAV
jgi:hypothetical protein